MANKKWHLSFLAKGIEKQKWAPLEQTPGKGISSEEGKFTTEQNA
jgi:hypothetical protein